jgi:cell division protein FtsI/penicillin-binding protein 2
VSKETAGALIEAMGQTVARGTARKAFRDRRGVPLLPDVAVGGKTGTLHGHHPFRAYSWFVGVAPADDPEVALAVLVVNEPKWRIKAAGTAAELLRKYFELKK